MKINYQNMCNIVGGTISVPTCIILASLAKQVPEDGMIFDLYSGEGRSTIAMAMALDEAEKVAPRIVAIDTHITNPSSSSPYEDGTIMKFLGHLRKFRVNSRVQTLISSDNMLALFNKRSANLIVLQAPACPTAIDDVFNESIQVSQEAIRKNGRIAILRPTHIPLVEFSRFVRGRFGDNFQLLINKNDVMVYEFTGGK